MKKVNSFELDFGMNFDLPAGVSDVDLMNDDLADLFSGDLVGGLAIENRATDDNLDDLSIEEFERIIDLELGLELESELDSDSMENKEMISPPLGANFAYNRFDFEENVQKFWDGLESKSKGSVNTQPVIDGFDFGFEGLKGQKEESFDGDLNLIDSKEDSVKNPVYQKAERSGRLGRAKGNGKRSAHPWMTGKVKLVEAGADEEKPWTWSNSGKLKIPDIDFDLESEDGEQEHEREQKAYMWSNTGKSKQYGLGRGKDKSYLNSLQSAKPNSKKMKKEKMKESEKIVKVPDFANWTKSDREREDWTDFKIEVDEVCGNYPIGSTRKLSMAMRKFVKASDKFNYMLRKNPKYFPIPDGEYRCNEDSVEIGIYAPDRKNQCGVRTNAENGVHFIVDAKAVIFTAKFKITGNGGENFNKVLMTINGKKCLPSWAAKKEGDFYTFVFVPTFSSGYVLGRGTSELETRRMHIEVFGKTWKVHKNIMVVIVNGSGIRKFFGNDQNPHDNGVINLENKELYTRMYIDQLIN